MDSNNMYIMEKLIEFQLAEWRRLEDRKLLAHTSWERFQEVHKAERVPLKVRMKDVFHALSGNRRSRGD
ncbi:hypothetical protein JCM10914A_49930 [Paenibacillus sp. JCM 10914]